MKLKVTVNEIPYEVEVELDSTPPALPIVNIGGGAGGGPVPVGRHSASVTAPLAGSVRKIVVSEGQAVKAGDVVAVLEAMKMETEIACAISGTIARILVEVGTAVQGGDPIIDIDPE